MAEQLLYNKNHWMDDLTEQQISDRIKNKDFTQEKFDSRYQKGDIVEIRWYGFWSFRHSFNRNAFAVTIECPLTTEDKTLFDTAIQLCSLPDGKLVRVAELSIIAKKTQEELDEFNPLYNTLVDDKIANVDEFLRTMNIVITDANDNKYLMRPEEEITNEGTDDEVRVMVKKRKYAMDISKEILVENKLVIDSTKKEAILSDKKEIGDIRVIQ